MGKIGIAVIALALGAGLTVSGGVATAASSVEASNGGVGIQCTRQYVLLRNADLRSDSPSGPVIAHGITGDKFNVPSASGTWYLGNLYDQYNTHLGYGYLLASSLAYTGVCF